MKKIMWLISTVVFVVILGGCSKKINTVEILETSHECFCYEGTEDVNRMTVDEEGLLYTITVTMPEYEEAVLAEDFAMKSVVQRVCVYDLEGNCIRNTELTMGTGSAKKILVQDGIMYCVVPAENEEMELYAVNVETWDITKAAVLTGYTNISDMVYVGEYMYLCGRYKQTDEKEYQLHPDIMSYSYNGEQISRVNLGVENPKVELMRIDFPIAICKKQEDIVVIYHYTEENGFIFSEYNHQKGVLTEAGSKNTVSKLLHLGGCGDGYLFTIEGNMYYGEVNGTEAQVLPERVSVADSIVYRKGFGFYMNSENQRKVERFCVTDVIRENKEIKLLMHDDTMDKPYGCGYRMNKLVVSEEQFALKVLAQDKDYDICLLSTNQSCAYNIKQNGAFYSLDEVDGVQEYLDACFPYVKELATNEDGDIWMIPVALAIPGIVYHKEYCKENNVDFAAMDFYEFLNFTMQMETEHPLMTDISSYMVYEEFFGHYLKSYDTFDTEIFRDYVKLLRQIHEEQEEWYLDADPLSEMISGNIPDFYYTYERYMYGELLNGNRMGSSEQVGIMGIPEMVDGIGNVGTITFLAVNPQSDNLEDSLAYISSFVKYMMEKTDSFMLADETMYTDTAYMRDLYQLYANGTVNFAMDTEVYWTPFSLYMTGEYNLEEMIAEVERRRKIYVGE